MLTKKHLEALAEALADVAVEFGADEEETVDRATFVVDRLRLLGVVTPNFDAVRFTNAVRNAYSGGSAAPWITDVKAYR